MRASKAFPAGAASRARGLFLVLALIAAPALAAAPAPVGAPEATLREDLQGARWPADVVRTATHVVTDVRKASLADEEAALRVARHPRDRAADARSDGIHDIGWLQYSAALGSAAGNYALAMHYRKDNQPALAAPYEARAGELGFNIPVALDNVRK